MKGMEKTMENKNSMSVITVLFFSLISFITNVFSLFLLLLQHVKRVQSITTTCSVNACVSVFFASPFTLTKLAFPPNQSLTFSSNFKVHT